MIKAWASLYPLFGKNLSKLEKSWIWEQIKPGEYNFGGIFNHNHVGRSWIWTQTTPTSNCIIPKSNPIPTNLFW